MKMSVTSRSARLPSAELMTWDTEFWGQRIAHASAPGLDMWARENTIGCMCLLIDAADTPAVHRAELQGYKLMDVRVKLERPINAPGESKVRPVHLEEIQDIAELARTAFRGLTRFYADPGFPDERCDDLYETWVRNSCTGYAQEVLVVGGPGPPAGFITLHKQVDESSIGLIAVSSRTRRRGVGGALVRGAINWAYTQGCRRMTVVTQGRNIAAQRCFQANGFRTQTVELWMHKWYV